MRGFASPVVIGIVVLAVVGGLLALQTKRLEGVKAEYAAFKANVKAAGDEQERRSKEKDAANAKLIKDSVADRDAALAKLRESANTRRRELSHAATATGNHSQVCFPTATYNAAVKRYRERLDRGLGGIQPLAVEGDAAAIDAGALINAWPH